MAEGSQVVSAGAEQTDEQNHSDASAQHPVADKPSSVDAENAKAATGTGSEAKGSGSGSMEKGFYQHFMNPMLSKLEASVQKNTEMLDDLHRKWEEERKEERRKQMSKHIPGPLQGQGQDLTSIMQHIQDLIIYENFNQEETDQSKFRRAHLKTLDENSEVAVLSHSIAAYVSTLDLAHLRHFTTRIVSDTTLWVSRLFRFSDSSAYFHEEEREGLLRVCRLALHQKYPKYATDGYDALYPRPPVFYMSAASKPGLGQYICTQLGLPISCLCTVPCNTVFGSQHKMDISTLEKLIQDDNASAKTPVLLVAYAGTPLVGHVDNIQRLQEVCKKSDMWLHIEGNNLATLAMFSVPTSIIPARSGDSMTLNLGSWLGLPAVPYVTLYKTADPALAHAAGLSSFNARYKLNCLPLWLCLQNLGHDGIVKRIKHACDLAKALVDMLSKIPTIEKVSWKKPPAKPKTERMGIGDIISKAICALVVFEIVNPTVVFRYQEAKTDPAAPEAAGGEKPEEEEPLPPQEPEQRNPYYDALNIWLVETLKREVTKVQIASVELEQQGICIRFAPLESAQALDTQLEDIQAFTECLQRQLDILDATVSQRPDFHSIVEAQDNLRIVELPNWAGLGAVQYIPEAWVDKLDNLPGNGAREINELNSNLVQQLKSADTAFSLGTSPDSLACVRFGLITSDTDLEELIALVYTTGKEVEDSSKFLETMAEVVREGIEAANKDLLKENEDKILQEGVLRQVPLVGSLLNWWSPPAKEAGIRGRSFNLASGKIESTETTYKYHMQVQEAPQDTSASVKQGPLKANLKPVKRRTASGSSVPEAQPSPNAASQVKGIEKDSPSQSNLAAAAAGDSANENKDQHNDTSAGASAGVPHQQEGQGQSSSAEPELAQEATEKQG